MIAWPLLLSTMAMRRLRLASSEPSILLMPVATENGMLRTGVRTVELAVEQLVAQPRATTPLLEGDVEAPARRSSPSPSAMTNGAQSVSEMKPSFTGRPVPPVSVAEAVSSLDDEQADRRGADAAAAAEMPRAWMKDRRLRFTSGIVRSEWFETVSPT